MNNFNNNLRKELSTLQKMKVFLTSKISKYPKGRLKIVSKNKFYHYIDKSNQRYIKKSESDFAKALAQKHYDLRILKKVDKKIKSLTKLLELYISNDFDSEFDELSKERRNLITPITLPKKIINDKWNNTVSSNRDFDNDNLVTINGEIVRSKSEKIIADALFSAGIPYKYEENIKVNNSIYSPDFTILHPITNKIIYWEHLGMLDNPEYISKVLRKLDMYTLNNINFHDNLILTFESSKYPLKTSIVEYYIREILEKSTYSY